MNNNQTAAKIRERRGTGKDAIQQMALLYENGWTMEAVGDKFGISKRRVGQILAQSGISRRIFTKSEKYLTGQKNRQRIIPKELLIELYCGSQLQISEIIKQLKTNLTIVRRSLDFHRIPKRTAQRVDSSPLTEELLRHLYLEEALTAREIADRLGYAPVTVQGKLWKFKIKKYKSR